MSPGLSRYFIQWLFNADHTKLLRADTLRTCLSWRFGVAVCLALSLMFTQYFHPSFTGPWPEPSWGRCHCFVLFWALKQEDDGKNNDYVHLLLLASPSFVVTPLSSEAHPYAEVLGWHSGVVGEDIGKSLQRAVSRLPNSWDTWHSSEDLVLSGLWPFSSSWSLQSHAFAHHGKKLLLSLCESQKKIRK